MVKKIKFTGKIGKNGKKIGKNFNFMNMTVRVITP
jgi:hypothetical protein